MTDQKRLAENIASLINEAEDLVDAVYPDIDLYTARDAQALLRTAAPNLVRIEDTVVAKALTNWHARVANEVGQAIVKQTADNPLFNI